MIRRVLYAIWTALVLCVLAVAQAGSMVSAARINELQGVYYDPSFDCSPQANTTGNGDTLVGNTNAEQAFNFFVSQGFTAVQSAGIIGNLMQESHVDPKSVQAGGPGRGIAQWSVGQRWDDFLRWNADQNKGLPAGQQKDQFDLLRQLQFMMHEMNSVPPWNQTPPALKATTRIENAPLPNGGIDPGSADVFEAKYEKAGKPAMANRYRFAHDALARFGGGMTPVVGDSNAGAGCDNAFVDPAPGNVYGPSAGIPCPALPGVKDGGDQDGYRLGKKIPIHVCIINGIDVNVKVATNVYNMIKDAKTDGIDLTGGGFRTMAEQTSLYIQHGCPHICSPPTARPGYSNHQMGLAIDFSLSGGMFNWLKGHAAKYGFHNFPAEAWHWSVDGK